MAKSIKAEEYRVKMAKQEDANEEKYQFPSLEKMDKAIIAAFNSYESNSCSFEKGLILSFTPTKSLIFDTQIRSTFIKYGGKLITD